MNDPEKTHDWPKGEPDATRSLNTSLVSKDKTNFSPDWDGGGSGQPQTQSDTKTIGRYRIEWVLGQGGSGIVYLAHDEHLQRHVAIKVPHRVRGSTPQETAAYLTEARTVASLDHPNIVPVHDKGSLGLPVLHRLQVHRWANAGGADQGQLASAKRNCWVGSHDC